MFGWNGDTSLAALFAAAFVSATLLPASSEAVLVAVIRAFPDRVGAAILVATLGNTLGGMVTYGVGRLLPHARTHERALERVRRHGAPILLLSWLPIVGDALCVAAGWLRVPWGRAAIAMAVGKLARYLAIAWAAT